MFIFALIMFSIIVTLLAGAASLSIIDSELSIVKVKHAIFVFILFPIVSLIFICIWWLIRNWNNNL